MKRTHIFALTAVTLAGILAMLLIDAGGRHQEPARPKLFPDLESGLERAARVDISSTDATVTLKRQGQTWLVEEKDGYPASVVELRRLLVSLARLQLFEKKTARPEHFARLGLLGLDQEASRARQVRIWSDANEVMAALLVGGAGANGGSYVRKIDDSQTWLASAAISAEPQASDWLDKRLLDIPASRIRTLRMKPARGTAYTLNRQDDGSYVIADLPAGATLDTAAVARLAEAFSDLQFDDVASATALDLGNAAWSDIEIEVEGGLRLRLRLAEGNGSNYLSALALADGSGDSLASNTAYWSGRYFVIPARRANAMAVGRESLLRSEAGSDGQSGG